MKQPDLICSLICDDVRREDNGKGILIGIFSTLNSILFPFVAEFHVFNVWTNGTGRFEEQTVVIDPDGRQLSAVGPIAFTLPDDAHRHYLNHAFRVAFTRPGRYFIKTLLGGEEKLTLPFDVVGEEEQISSSHT